MKQHSRLCRAILAGAFLISGLAFGVEASAVNENPCSEDLAKFCGDIKPGRRAVMECLERHEAQLSQACKDYEAKVEKTRMEAREVGMQQTRVRQACAQDITKLCNEVTSGNGLVTTCLKEHEPELSMPCRDAVVAAKGGAEERTSK